MVEVTDLTFEYGSEPVLSHVSFTAHPGEITAVIGANGVGKSTLLRCVAGLCSYRGQIKRSGKDSAATVGYLCQNSGCISSLTVFEVILMGLVNELSFRVGPEKLQRVEEIMELMDLTPYASRSMTWWRTPPYRWQRSRASSARMWPCWWTASPS